MSIQFGRCLLIIVVGVAMTAARAAMSQSFTNFTYTGDGADPSAWNDPNNWTTGGATNGYPDSRCCIVTINGSASLTSGIPSQIASLYLATNGPVILRTGALNIYYSSGMGLQSYLTVHSNGADFGSADVTAARVTLNGDLTAKSLVLDQYGDITQIAGKLRLQKLQLAYNSSSVSIRGWSFGREIGLISCNHATFNFVGQPTFEDAVRPDWTLFSFSGFATMDLKGYTLWGNVLTLGGHPTILGTSSRLINTTAGATVDVNRIVIQGGDLTKIAYLALTNTEIIVRGGGTNWLNLSSNSAAFNITNNTIVIFAPTGGTACLNSGSQDRHSVTLNPTDWNSNFSFGTIRIDAGATITLVGNDTFGTGQTNAVYAYTIEGIDIGSTVKLNGHNVYLLRRARGVTFDYSGGGKVYQPMAGTIISLR
jgi:hypothetical protein